MVFETIITYPGMQYISQVLTMFFAFVTTYIITSKVIVAVFLQGILNVFFVLLFPWRSQSIDNMQRLIYFFLNFFLSTLTFSLVALQTANPSAFQAYWFSMNYYFILILQVVLNDQEITFF